MMDSRNGDTPLRVGISGSYGGFNLGNEAILQVILDELPRFAPLEITVFSRDAKARAAAIVSSTSPNCVGHLGVRRRRPLHNLDLFILGGGDLLYDADADMYLREVGLADDVGNPVMTYAISAGPLVDPAYARGAHRTRSC